MSLADLIDRTATCVKCGKTRRGGCDCWVPCACRHMKERGTAGCPRCAATTRTRIAPGHYVAFPMTAEDRVSEVTVRKAGRFWRFTLKCGCGCGVESNDGREFGSAKDALMVGIGQAFEMLDDAASGGGR